jgi:acetoin utilization protein AcuB
MTRAIGVSSGRLVYEAMTTAVLAVAPDQAVEDARRLAKERGAHHLLVLDEGALVGILCRCDLEEAAPGSPVSDCMSVPVETVRPDATLSTAVATMADLEVGCLPVVAGGLVLGMLSEEDVRAGGATTGAVGRCWCHCRQARTHRVPSKRKAPPGAGNRPRHRS